MNRQKLAVPVTSAGQLLDKTLLIIIFNPDIHARVYLTWRKMDVFIHNM